MNEHGAALFEQSLTIVYRILFLLFAEARRLVPAWHAIYRDAYSIETLRGAAEGGRAGETAGLWETLQAISRLAHRGCRAGSLVVSPFNGRLFSPSRTPLGESGRLDDRVARDVIIALSTRRPGANGNRVRISYRDLGVEQLGAVYESVLEYEPRLETLPPGHDVQCVTVRTSTSSGRTAGGACTVRPELAEGRTPGRRGPAVPRIVVRLEPGSGRRKATGSFYTPQSLTGYLVRRTLHPLVDRATADQILALRVVDPAMGSGAFLVAACRYLAARYEQALVAEGQLHPADIGEHDRALFRRLVAQRCLFGVDRNPMAVQLAQLSLWLATLAADCPLTFLDHHLASGDSLVGAAPADLLASPHFSRGRTTPDPRASAQRTLFDGDELRADLERLLPERLRVGNAPGETLAAVQDKERTIQRLAGAEGPMRRWKEVADLWCACWFWERPNAPTRGVYQDVADALLGRHTTLPAGTVRALVEHARAVAASRRFFHWQIEFPEVFFDAAGTPLPNAGFDAVVGNPPWDMLRADAGERESRSKSEGPTSEKRKAEDPESDRPAPERPPVRTSDESDDEKAYDRALARFARASRLYVAQSDGHQNRFQLFTERAFHLVRRGGRVGLVVPWGLFSDRGCAALRRLLFGHADTDTILAFDNARAIFPIHRSVRFALVTATNEGPTARVQCRFGEQDAAFPDSAPDDPREAAGDCYPIVLTPSLLAKVSGEDLDVPDIRSRRDLEILDRAASTFPRLSDGAGWNARFGRELNATDDREHFVERGVAPSRSGNSVDRLLPVLEGKHLEPFVARVADCRLAIPAVVARRLLARHPVFGRPRLAYRDVASATNRVTLIAAMLPGDCVTTHTVFCLKGALDEEAQWFLCGVMNSYVANYLVRLRVTTHVSAGVIARLPVPFLDLGAAAVKEIVIIGRQLAARLAGVHDDRLQALVASLYGLTVPEFEHVLRTFPLVEKERREGAFAKFVQLASP